MNPTLIPVPLTQTRRMPTDESIPDTKHVAVFGHSPQRVSLQVRSEGKIIPSGKGKSWQCYSVAYLDLSAAEAVRDALVVWITEQKKES